MFDLSSPTTFIPVIFLTLVAIFVSILYKDAKKNIKENNKDLPYYLETAVSMNYIKRNILDNGRFKYRNHINSEVTYENKTYNALRHAGVLYSMYLYETLGLETEHKELRIKSSKYFVDRYVKKFGKNKYIVISRPEEEQINIPVAKTGAVGIALCALSNLYKENEIELEILQGLGEFLISMQNKDGNIYAYYDLSTKTVNKEATAVYYPAEAAFGLINLYMVDPQEKWLNAAKKTIDYIVKTRKSMDLDITFDHWSALAIEELFKNNLVTPEEKNTYRMYLEQMAIATLTNQITNKNNSYYGAFKDNIRPCSIGTIMEGLASIYYCTDNTNFKKVIFNSLSIGNMFLSKVQVKTGEQAGGIPNSANWVKPGVTPNASVIRIDNVQHVVSGWLKFQNILKITGNY